MRNRSSKEHPIRVIKCGGAHRDDVVPVDFDTAQLVEQDDPVQGEALKAGQTLKFVSV